MESGPSEIVEKAVGFLIPPASREEVLGDMRERCGSTGQFLAEASHVVPFVILSRVQRTSDKLILLMEAISAYTAFFAAAWFLERSFLYSDWGLGILSIPPAAMLLAVTVADAYHDPKRAWRPMVVPALCLAAACLFELPFVPREILAWGGEIAIMLVASLRMVFPHIADRQSTAKIPAFWMKLDAVPVKTGYVLLIVVVVAFYAVSRIWG